MRILISILLCFFLASCKSTPNNSFSILNPKQELAKKGGLIFTVSINRGEFYVIKEIEVVNTATKQKAYIPVTSSTYSTVGFVGFLENGHYVISKLKGLSQGQSFEIKVSQAFRNFDIKTGEILDLGHVVQKSLLDGKFDIFQTVRDQFVFDNLIDSSNLSSIANLKINKNTLNQYQARDDYSESSRSSKNSLIDWLIDLSTDDIGVSEEQWNSVNSDAAKLELTKSLVSPTNGFVEKEGFLSAGGAIGQVFIFENEKWKRIDTGILGSILSVDKVNESITAGSEYGTLLSSHDNGKTWKESISLLPKNELFHKIHCLDNNSCFAVTSVLYGQVAKIYKFDPNNVEKFKLVYEKKLANRPLLGFTSYIYQGEIILGLPGNEVVKYNLLSNEVNTLLVENEFDLLYFNEASGIMTAVKKTGMAFGRKHYSSADLGSTWSAFDMSYMTSDVFALSDKEAIATVVTNGITRYEIEIRRTTNSGQNWKLISKIQPRCLSFRKLMYSNEFLCSTYTGVVLKSTDGQKWIKQSVEKI